ncbi:MAG: thiamine pyrophosphate-dependent enzyme [bacterium]|nr:thiamine pyrophosphate-dependent enzyme [bacterium]
MKVVFKRPDSLRDVPHRYCPGCGHGIAHRLVAEVIDELNIQEEVIGIAPVGCAVFAYEYFNIDMTEVAHGRPPAAATGIKRANPKKVVFTYQGDGDLAAIGMAETIHAAARGERITVIFINNTVYGMTGGQMAPTTLLDQKTATTPYGRSIKDAGYPIKMCELLGTLNGVAYLARTALDTPTHILKAKAAIKKAFQVQLDDLGLGLVEILSPCPSIWGLSPKEAIKWIQEKMIPVFKLGEFVTVDKKQ